ncbi:hypothetical protein, partial [Bradyrhizobium sp. JYMT SZCCT0428]|uniref:hypothetical protein n=1 Tax=Bradyrhizobium sp. JYMT SZCCT0428 TaxID=2807673 RepID=UPI001BACE8FF
AAEYCNETTALHVRPQNSGDGILAARANALIGQKPVSRVFSSCDANVAVGSIASLSKRAANFCSYLISGHR